MGDRTHLMSVREPLALDLIKSEICVFCAGPVNGNKEGVSPPPLQHRVAPNANGDLVRRGLHELKAVGELF